jgi:hypothetical protein
MFLLAWVCVINSQFNSIIKAAVYSTLQESLRDCIIDSVNIHDIGPGAYSGACVK